MPAVEPCDTGPIDCRKDDASFSKIQWSHDQFPFISITRQVHINTDDPDDFDGSAISMDIRMHFEPGDLESGNHWIDVPANIVEFQAVLKQKDDLNGFWKVKSTNITAMVGTVG